MFNCMTSIQNQLDFVGILFKIAIQTINKLIEHRSLKDAFYFDKIWICFEIFAFWISNSVPYNNGQNGRASDGLFRKRDKKPNMEAS